MMWNFPRRLAFAALMACGALSACTEYQGRQTNCWSPAKPAQTDTVARDVLAFADTKRGCDFVELNALVPLDDFAKGIEE